MKFRYLVVCLLVIACSPFARSAPTSTPTPTPGLPDGLQVVPPTGSVIAQVPSPASWSMTYSYPEERVVPTPTPTPAKKPVNKSPTPIPTPVPSPTPAPTVSLVGRLRSFTATQVGDVIHVLMTRVKAAKEEVWKSGLDEYAKSDGAVEWTKAVTEGAPDDPVRMSHEFPDVDWLSRDDYVVTMPYNGVRCDLFIEDVPSDFKLKDLKGLNALLAKSSLAVFVNQKTRLPVEVRYKGVIITFDFLAPPETLSYPPDLVNQLDQAKHVRATLNQRATKPY